METFFPTSTPSVIEEMQIKIDNLTTRLEVSENQKSANYRQMNEIKDQVRAVKDYITNLYSMHGEIDEDIKEIAELLEIELTRHVEGTATIEISFSFDAPLDFDIDSFELSVDVTEDSYEVSNFDWFESSTDIECEEA
jgi:sugar-specific transcriptional regulator TrmB